MKAVLVTGVYGQLGSCLRDISVYYPDYTFYFTDVDTLDICDQSAVISFFETRKIDYVINCAAYTAVDKAEQEEELSYRINCEAIINLGNAANQVGARLIHISTDYVFNGKAFRPYDEEEIANPVSVYGKSKREGEIGLQSVSPESIIIRTSWLYSEYGNNFMKTMLRLGNERSEIRVVVDQIGTPTYAGDLAKVIMVCLSAENKWAPGILHFSNEGICSWYDFAISIFRIAGSSCQTVPISTNDYPTKASRPFYSVLDKSKIKRIYNLTIPHWEVSLNQCYNKYKNQK